MDKLYFDMKYGVCLCTDFKTIPCTCTGSDKKRIVCPCWQPFGVKSFDELKEIAKHG